VKENPYGTGTDFIISVLGRTAHVFQGTGQHLLSRTGRTAAVQQQQNFWARISRNRQHLMYSPYGTTVCAQISRWLCVGFLPVIFKHGKRRKR
jgi:hypothetical protein